MMALTTHIVAAASLGLFFCLADDGILCSSDHFDLSSSADLYSYFTSHQSVGTNYQIIDCFPAIFLINHHSVDHSFISCIVVFCSNGSDLFGISDGSQPFPGIRISSSLADCLKLRNLSLCCSNIDWKMIGYHFDRIPRNHRSTDQCSHLAAIRHMYCHHILHIYPTSNN